MTYTPMPNHLEHQLRSIVSEIKDPQADAGNTVFVIREALAQAYVAGHQEGHEQAASQLWITEDLKKTFEARKAKLRQARDAAPAAKETTRDH